MNFRMTYALFGMVAVMIVAILIGGLLKRKGNSNALLVRANAARLTPAKITGVEIEHTQPTAQTFAFERTGPSAWKFTQPTTGRADSSQLNRVVEQVLNARRDTSAEVGYNPAAYGLDKPGLRVTLKEGSKVVGTLAFGTATIGGRTSADVYATSDDNPGVPVAVSLASVDSLFKSGVSGNAGEMAKSLNEYRAPVLLADGIFDGAEKINVVRLEQGTGDKKQAVELARTADGSWRFTVPASYGAAAIDSDTSPSAPGTPPSGIKPLFASLGGLRVAPEDIIESPGSLATFGLDDANPNRLSITLNRKPGPVDPDEPNPLTETLLIGKDSDAKPGVSADKVYAKRPDESVVYKVSAKAIEPFRLALKRPDALRDRDLLVASATTTVDAIDLKLPGEPTVQLRHYGEPKAWKFSTTAGLWQPANNANVANLLATVSTRRIVTDFAPAGKTAADLGFDKPAAEISLWIAGLKSTDADKPNAVPELKDAKPTVKLLIGKRDKDLLYVRRETKAGTSDVAIPAKLYDLLTKGELDYVDPTLPSFVSTEVASLTFTHNGQTVEVEAAADGKSWKFKQPADRAGRTADVQRVMAILGNLAATEAVKLIARKAEEKDLERWGLKPPRAEIKVTLRSGMPKERIYLFGKDTDEANRATMYAKQGERDVVFWASRSILSMLTLDGLQDPTVMQFDIAKVKGMKLSGWEELGTGLIVLDLLRKSPSEWVYRTKGNFDLDPAKAEILLTSLNGLRATAFLGKEVKADYKLTPAAGGLTIEIEVEGEKTPLTLTLGGSDSAGSGLYAQSKQVADQVFVIPKGGLDEVKRVPAYFRKK